MKRTAYNIRVRRMVTGTDYSALLFLRSPQDALTAMKRYIPREERNWLRVVYCDPATVEQIAAHKARLATL